MTMYQLDELPYKEFAALGLTKETIAKFPEKQLNNLLEGGKTDVATFRNVKLADGSTLERLDAQISLKRNEAGQATLTVHPMSKSQNQAELSENLVEQTKATVVHTVEVKTKFKLEELPYHEMAALGLTKQNVSQLPQKQLSALLEGGKTELTTYKDVKLSNGTTIDALDAQISIHRNESGSPSLTVHPVSNSLQNTYAIAEKEALNQTVSNPESSVKDIIKADTSQQGEVKFDKETMAYQTVESNVEKELKPQFKLEQLPYKQLEAIGFTKQDITNLPEKQLAVFLDGGRSDLTTLKNIQLEGGAIIDSLDAKVSLKSNKWGDPSLAIHTVRNEPENIYQLSEKEVSDLTTGKVESIAKEVYDKLENKQEVTVKYDKDLNDFYVENPRENVKEFDVNLSQVKEKNKIIEEQIEIKEDVVEKTKLDHIKGFLRNSFMFALDGGMSQLLKAAMKYLDKQPAKEVKELSEPAGVRTLDKIRQNSPSDTSSTANSSGLDSSKLENSRVNNPDVSKSEQLGSDTIIPIHVVADKYSKALQTTSQSRAPQTLIDYGPSPYDFKEGNKASYYAIIESKKGQKTVWGSDLERAISESGAKRGDKITLDKLGHQNVKVSQDIRDEAGAIIGTKEINAKRMEWAVDVVSKGQLNDTQLASLHTMKSTNVVLDNSKKITR